MTERTITIELTVPDDVPEDLDGVSAVVDLDGVDSRAAAAIIMAAAENLIRDTILAELVIAQPLATGDTLRAMAALNARLAAVDAIMHLPMGDDASAVLRLD